MSETAFAYAEERQALSWESNLSIRFKQDMKARTELFDTLPPPGVGWPKAGRKQLYPGQPDQKAHRNLQHQRGTVGAQQLADSIPANLRGSKVNTVQSPHFRPFSLFAS